LSNPGGMAAPGLLLTEGFGALGLGAGPAVWAATCRGEVSRNNSEQCSVTSHTQPGRHVCLRRVAHSNMQSPSKDRKC